MKKVLVTGAFGQLGTELRLLTEGRPEFLFTDIRPDESFAAGFAERGIQIITG